MIGLGIVLAILGLLLNVPALWSLGLIVILVGLVLAILGFAGRPVGGRRHYW